MFELFSAFCLFFLPRYLFCWLVITKVHKSECTATVSVSSFLVHVSQIIWFHLSFTNQSCHNLLKKKARIMHKALSIKNVTYWINYSIF